MMKKFAALQAAATLVGSAWILPACAAPTTKAQPKAQASSKSQAARIAELEKQVAALRKQLDQANARLALANAAPTRMGKATRQTSADAISAQLDDPASRAEMDARVARLLKPTRQAEAETKEKKPVPAALNFTMKSLEGKDVNLSQYAGRPVLIVNTASKCGNTPQYEGLEKVFKQYKDQGLVVLGFPSADFGGQELDSDEEIASFCQKNFGVSFPMFSKVKVKGEGKAPLFEFLTSEKTNPESPGEIDWNFGKFLIDRDGNIAARFKASVKPEAPEVTAAIEKALAPAA